MGSSVSSAGERSRKRKEHDRLLGAEDNAFVVASTALLERERKLYVAPSTGTARLLTAPAFRQSVELVALRSLRSSSYIVLRSFEMK